MDRKEILTVQTTLKKRSGQRRVCCQGRVIMICFLKITFARASESIKEKKIANSKLRIELN